MCLGRGAWGDVSGDHKRGAEGCGVAPRGVRPFSLIGKGDLTFRYRSDEKRKRLISKEIII